MGLGAIEKGMIGDYVNDRSSDPYKVCILACMASIADDLEEIRRRMPRDPCKVHLTPQQKQAIIELMTRRD